MIAFALVLTLMAGQSGAISSVTQELTQIEQQLATRWKNGDCDAWGSLIHADWSVIHITGATLTKAEALKMCRAPDAPTEAHSVDELSVRPFGDAAVVTGRTIVTLGGTSPETIKLRFTDVFIRREGRWQIVASHATRLPS
jgi:hypothetical protein